MQSHSGKVVIMGKGDLQEEVRRWKAEVIEEERMQKRRVEERRAEESFRVTQSCSRRVTQSQEKRTAREEMREAVRCEVQSRKQEERGTSVGEDESRREQHHNEFRERWEKSVRIEEMKVQEEVQRQVGVGRLQRQVGVAELGEQARRKRDEAQEGENEPGSEQDEIEGQELRKVREQMRAVECEQIHHVEGGALYWQGEERRSREEEQICKREGREGQLRLLREEKDPEEKPLMTLMREQRHVEEGRVKEEALKLEREEVERGLQAAAETEAIQAKEREIWERERKRQERRKQARMQEDRLASERRRVQEERVGNGSSRKECRVHNVDAEDGGDDEAAIGQRLQSAGETKAERRTAGRLEPARAWLREGPRGTFSSNPLLVSDLRSVRENKVGSKSPVLGASWPHLQEPHP